MRVKLALIALWRARCACGHSRKRPKGRWRRSREWWCNRRLPEAQGRLKVRVALVNTPVTVRDDHGQMIHDLDAKDFLVTDNGVTQKISHFDLGGDPLSLVILVETSSRIASIFPEIRRDGDSVYANGDGAERRSRDGGIQRLGGQAAGFYRRMATRSREPISGMQEGTSGSRLYDAMAVGVEMLTSRPQATAETAGRRRVLLILSEATDVGSGTKLGEVLRQAQLANITIYSVGLSTTRAELQSKNQKQRISATPPGVFGQPPLPGTVQTPTSEEQRYGNIDVLALAVWAVQHAENQVKDHALEVAATATGGAHLATFRDSSIEKAIDEIGGELHSQYSLSYTPTGRARWDITRLK